MLSYTYSESCSDLNAPATLGDPEHEHSQKYCCPSSPPK